MTFATRLERGYRVRFDEAGPDGTLRSSGYLRYAQDLHNNIEKAIRQKKPNAARVAVRKLLENSDDMIATWERRGRRR